MASNLMLVDGAGVVLAAQVSASRLDQLMALCHQGLVCDKTSGPVCAVDAAGLPKNFPDACHVLLENCILMTSKYETPNQLCFLELIPYQYNYYKNKTIRTTDR